MAAKSLVSTERCRRWRWFGVKVALTLEGRWSTASAGGRTLAGDLDGPHLRAGVAGHEDGQMQRVQGLAGVPVGGQLAGGAVLQDGLGRTAGDERDLVGVHGNAEHAGVASTARVV